MGRSVLALAAALVLFSGCVWYVPAVVDLRAGDDRPASTRTAAAACLTGWAAVAGVAVLLAATAVWWAPAGAAVAGAAATAGLRLRAGGQRRREARETASQLAALRLGPGTPPHGGRGARGVFAALVGSGLLGGTAVAACLIVAGPGGGRAWTPAAAASAAVVALFVALAVTYAMRPPYRRAARAARAARVAVSRSAPEPPR
ncbi:hypothetical protein ACH4ZX_25950 [Streptomyces sp. NPDC020490]|uniref:hypothetical protein n=1 Tax=Streptomyces sp. NPDC020490 TaxID=3365078 RepID=UPI0037B3F48F